MKRIKLKTTRRQRRKAGVRKRAFGVPGQPRLSVFRSARHIYAQVIDDVSGRTLASASTVEKDCDSAGGGNRAAAKDVGSRLADRAKAAGVEKIVFDRNGFRFHGRVASLAEGAREGGLKF